MECAVSFVKQSINLKGNVAQPAHRFKTCDKCETKKPPEGGMDMGRGRWICAACWTQKALRKK